MVQLLRPHMKGTATANVLFVRHAPPSRGEFNVQTCPVAMLAQLRAATHTTLVGSYDQLAQIVDEVSSTRLHAGLTRPALHFFMPLPCCLLPP